MLWDNFVNVSFLLLSVTNQQARFFMFKSINFLNGFCYSWMIQLKIHAVKRMFQQRQIINFDVPHFFILLKYIPFLRISPWFFSEPESFLLGFRLVWLWYVIRCMSSALQVSFVKLGNSSNSLFYKKMSECSWMKFEYLENEKSFLDEIKKIFHSFWRPIIWWKNKKLIKIVDQSFE